MGATWMKSEADVVLTHVYSLSADDPRRPAGEALFRLILKMRSPERRLAVRALETLSADPWDVPPSSPAGDQLSRAVERLARGLIYHPSRDVRQRCARLVGEVLREAAKLEQQQGVAA